MTAPELNLYISPSGSDEAGGSLAKPFRTLGRAVSRVGEDAGLYGKINIFLREGSYYLETPVELNERTLGSRDTPLLITNYRNEPVSVTGAAGVTPQWSVYEGPVWMADIGPGRMVDALYVNGERQIMARYPNYEPGKTLGGYAADALSKERVARWKNPAGGYIRALHHAEWGGNSYRITGKTADNELLYEWVGDNNRGNEMHAVKRMVENIFEELDAPGEWFYNKETGVVYYYPAKGLSMENAAFEIVTAEELFRITGMSAKAPQRHITIRGLSLIRTHRTMFTREYERPLRGDWGMVRAGAVFMENTEDICIQGCSFEDIGGNGITMSGYNQENTVDDCSFAHVGATGVLVMGKLSAVRDASAYDGENHKTQIQDFVPGPASEDYPRRIRIENSYFYDIGTYEKQTAAVCMSISEFVTVRRNTVHHTSRAGINVHDGTFGGHVIEGNDLFDCVTETADHGPINCWGRDRYWSVPQHDAMGYYGREKRAFALLDARSTSVIRGNRVYATYAFGIDIDDGASNYDIYNNLCIGVGIKLRDGFDRRVHNNVLIGSNLEHHMSFAYNNDLIYSNIICSRKICNSLCINEGATTFFSYNTYWNMGNEVQDLPEPDHKSIVADPDFLDFAHGNYQVGENSPAKKQGFLNFPMADEDFGRPDAPNPPAFLYVDGADSDQTFRFYDVLLSNITGEGMRSAAGLPDLSGVFILEREVLGLFCKLGLPIGTGDVIRQVGEHKIGNVEDFLEAFREIPLNVPVKISIYRSQKPLELTFIKQTEDFTSITEEAREEWQENAVQAKEE